MSKDLVDSMRHAWARLETWCQNNHPQLLEVLNPGASGEELDALERAIGQPLPPDVRESLSIHNGDDGQVGFIFGDESCSTESITGVWSFWRDFENYNEEFRHSMESIPQEAIALDYANPGWIPLTNPPGTSDYLGVDLAPGPNGKRGQVINFGRDEHRKCVLASNWAEFLHGYATFLESGVLVEIDLDLEVWGETVRAALGDHHSHDVLRELRQAGRWPPPRSPV